MDRFRDVTVSYGMKDFPVPAGQIGRILVNSGYDFNALRPYRWHDGNTYVSAMDPSTGQPKLHMLNNANETMMYEDWRTWDDIMIAAYKERLGFVEAIMSLGLTRNVNAMTTMVLSHQRQTDITGAETSFDGLSRSDKDRPEYDIVNIPLPFFHKDVGFNMRELSIARAHGTPLDTRTLTLAARRVAELVEATALGNVTAPSYGSYGSVYGIRTHPSRATKSLTLPTASGWSPSVTYNEIIDMKTAARQNLCYGPYILLVSSNWEPYLDRDYSAVYPGPTLRTKTAAMNNISRIVQLDKLDGYQMILFQPSRETVRMIIGMAPRLIQWTSPDGGYQNYRWITCEVPQFFTDIVGNCGVVHGTAS